MGDDTENKVDLISDLPQDIIERILNKLHMDDAARTSILSRKWRYKWTIKSEVRWYVQKTQHLDHLLAKLITNYFFLHEGTIKEFSFVNIKKPSNPKASLDQSLLFLSRKAIKKLRIGIDELYYYKTPSYLFNCKELTYLEMCGCKIGNPPPSFKGFLFLKVLVLEQAFMPNCDSLISSCPLLSHLTISGSIPEGSDLTICAPNLKSLNFRGNIKNIYLENTPLLSSVDVFMPKRDNDQHEDDAVVEHPGCCNFDIFLGRIRQLESIYIEGYFSKYLSIGIERSNMFLQPQYKQLRFFYFDRMSFVDMDKIRLLFRLIVNSPNLERLNIFEPYYRRDDHALDETTASLNWNLIMKKEWPKEDYMLSRLEKVEIRNMNTLKNATKFIKFLLERGPQLQDLQIFWYKHMADIYKSIGSTALERHPRASKQARLIFSDWI